MNNHQEKFYSFIMERVDTAYKEDAGKLLKETFEKQNNGTFDMEVLQKFENTMVCFLKPEHKEEVLSVMKQFKQQF